MHIRITSNISQSQKLLNLEKSLNDLKPVFYKLGEKYQKLIDERFQNEGGNYYHWDKSKSAIRRGGLTLTDKGNLRRSFVKGNKGNIFDVSNNQLVFGSSYRVNNIGLARLHHYGSSNMMAWGRYRFILPARKILINNPEVRKMFMLTMKEHINNALK